jgi:hypothetical protein
MVGFIEVVLVVALGACSTYTFQGYFWYQGSTLLQNVRI